MSAGVDSGRSIHFVDSHCHFDFKEFDDDRAEIWSSCKRQGVIALVIPGVSPEQWPRAARLSEDFPDFNYAAGLHPWWVDSYLEKFASVEKAIHSLTRVLSEQLKYKKCVAVGECGLDKMIDTSMDIQEAFLRCHVDVAKHMSKPLVIHSRRTHAQLLKCLREYRPNSGGVIHGFSGSFEEAKSFVDLGFSIGVGGTITYPRAKKTRAAIRQIPLESIVLETDAPDMPLDGRQGVRNSPERIPDIARTLAELRGLNQQEIAATTTANALRIFRLPIATA